MFDARFQKAVADALANDRLQRALYGATSAKHQAHRQGLADLHDADALRSLAADLKQHTLDHLDHYLDQFVEQARQQGASVHFANDGQQVNEIVAQIARQQQLTRCVKSKSMTTEETGLNQALEAVGMDVVETDLGEFIVQIDHDRPSHIVTPIIHKDRQTIARAMVRELGIEYSEDATQLTQEARQHLRAVFRRADLGITGVNFAIAETGSICLCTNEGNGRLTTTRPRVHVAIMGLEKVIPRLADLGVFLKLLARSGTGQPLTVYTSILTGPKRRDDADGPEQLHIVILDGGRRAILNSEYRPVLRCIRCGACLNFCPVYGKIGGHAYGSVYPGPIGKVLTPLLGGLPPHDDLPQASSLCGLCREVCPVQIDLPKLLVQLRRDAVAQRTVTWWHRVLFRWAARMTRSARRYRWSQRWARFLLKSGYRGYPAPARQSFRQWWAQQGHKADANAEERL